MTGRPDEQARAEAALRGEAVVANLRRDAALVEWAQTTGLAVRVDRRSRWGNPFVLGRDGNRDAVCDRYRDEHLPSRPDLLEALPSLRGKVLLCWCHPERCHAHALAEAAMKGGLE